MSDLKIRTISTNETLVRNCCSSLWRRIKKFETLLTYLPNESEATLIENGVISSFNYISNQQKYLCVFEGAAGGERLKSIFTNTSTRGYILFEDNESNIQLETKRMEGAIIFITNSGEFID
ncbi:12848_t:CDS:2, partial [Funneliformis mosseae]